MLPLKLLGSEPFLGMTELSSTPGYIMDSDYVKESRDTNHTRQREKPGDGLKTGR